MSREDVTIMAHRRADWGSVSRVSPGVWRIRYWADGADGYRRRSKTVRGSRKDAGDALAALRLDHSADAPCPTVGQCWELWARPSYERRVDEGDMSPQTLVNYDSFWRAHIAPRWADRQLTAIRPLDVQEWALSLPPSRASTILAVARKAAGYAVDYGASPSNPFDGRFETPSSRSIKRHDKGVLDLDGLRAAYGSMARRGSWLLPSFILCALGSCRVGESLGPRGVDVSMDEVDGVAVAAVAVDRQVSHGGRRVTDRLKSEQSHRTVVVPGPPALLLGDRALEVGDGLLAFDGSGLPPSREALRHEWADTCLDAGIPRHPYRNLRAGWRTLMEVELGVNPAMLEKLMGHAGKGVTERHYFRPSVDELKRAVVAAYKAHPFADDWGR